MSDSSTRLAEIAGRLEEISARLGSEEVDDAHAAELTDEAAKLAGELLSEAEAEMRRASAADE